MAKDDAAAKRAAREQARQRSRAVYAARVQTRQQTPDFSHFSAKWLPDNAAVDRGPKLEPREQLEIEHQLREFAEYARIARFHPSQIVHNEHLRDSTSRLLGQMARTRDALHEGWDNDTSTWLALNVADFVPEGLKRQYVEYSAQHPERQWAGPRSGAFPDGTPRRQLPSHKIDRGKDRPTFGLQQVLHSPAHLGPFERWQPARVAAYTIQAGRVVAAGAAFAKGRNMRVHTNDRPVITRLHPEHGLNAPKQVREARRACVDAWDKWMDWDGLAANLSAQGKQQRRAYRSIDSMQPDREATEFSFMRTQMDHCYPYFVPTPHGSPMMLYTRPPAYRGFNRAQRETFNFALARLAHTQLAEMTKPGSTLDAEVQKGIKATAITQARIMAVSDDGGVVPLGEIPVNGPFGHRTGYLTDDKARARVVLGGGSGTAKTDMAKAMIQAADAPLSVMIEVKKSDADKIAMEFRDQGFRTYQVDLTPGARRDVVLKKVTPVESIHDYFPGTDAPGQVGWDLVGDARRFLGPDGMRVAATHTGERFQAVKKKNEVGKKNSDTNFDFYREPMTEGWAAARVLATLQKIEGIRAGNPDVPYNDLVKDNYRIMSGYEPTLEVTRSRIAALQEMPNSGMPTPAKGQSLSDGEYRGRVFEALVRDGIAHSRDVIDPQAASEMVTAAERFRSIVAKTEKTTKGGDSIPQFLCREELTGTESCESWEAEPGGILEAAVQAELAKVEPGRESDALRGFSPLVRDYVQTHGWDVPEVGSGYEPGDGATVRKARAANAKIVVAVEGENEASINYGELLYTAAVRRQYTELKDEEVECMKELEGAPFTLPAVLDAYQPTGGLPTKASQRYFSGQDLWDYRMSGGRLFAPPGQVVSDNEAGTRFWKEDPRVLETGYGIRQMGQLEIDSIPKGSTLDKMGIGTDLLADQIVIGTGNFHRDNTLVDLAHDATLDKGEYRGGFRGTVLRPALPRPSREHIRQSRVLGGTVGENGDTRWFPVEDGEKGKVRHIEYTTAVKVDKASGRDTPYRAEAHPTSQDSVYVIRTITTARPHQFGNWMPRHTADSTLAPIEIRPEDGRVIWPEPPEQDHKMDNFALRGARRAVRKAAREVAESPTQLVNRNKHVVAVEQAVNKARKVELSAINSGVDSSADGVGRTGRTVEEVSGSPDATPMVAELPRLDGPVEEKSWGTVRDRRRVQDDMPELPQHPDDLDGGIEGP